MDDLLSCKINSELQSSYEIVNIELSRLIRDNNWYRFKLLLYFIILSSIKMTKSIMVGTLMGKEFQYNIALLT